MGPMSFRTVLMIAGAATLLAACANPNADKAADARQTLVGMPKETLLSCAGVPQRTAQVGDSEFMTYASAEYSGGGPTTSFGVGGGSGGSGVGFGIGIPLFGGGGGGYSSSCEATFTVRNGVVQQLSYTGSAGASASLGQCYRIVENCVAQVPAGAIPPR
ncbi:hypothetical protein N825_29245 [Skermanella stibiiresistens SB22]|uniref:Uncharacterized protein n=2 Tax=Skermanella TaxID=204447 RepID=W9GU90_9PROT|nr:hypothetical protein N825_29245 [Skermanella stibiiresistens SB22]